MIALGVISALAGASDQERAQRLLANLPPLAITEGITYASLVTRRGAYRRNGRWVYWRD